MGARLWQMLIKEFIQVFRDKRTRFVLIVPPMVQMVIFGYAATYEIRHVPMAVLDLDNSQESRDLISRFQASPYFQIQARLSDRRQIAEVINRGDVVLALHIHPGFAKQLRQSQPASVGLAETIAQNALAQQQKGLGASVQVIVDGTNSNTALIALGYVNQIANGFAEDYQREAVQRLAPLLAAQVPRIELERRPWYNPDLHSRWFFIPGIIGSLLGPRQ